MTAESVAGKVRGCDENQFGPEMSRELFHPFLLGFSESCVAKKLGDWSSDRPEPGHRCDPFIQRVEVLQGRFDTRHH